MVNHGFVLYRPTDGTGWGNRLRGLTLCHLLARATGRSLYVDDVLINEHFDSPFEIDWTWSRAPASLKTSATTKLRPRLSPSDWDQAAWESYQRDDLNSIFSGTNWELNAGLSFADALLLNPLYLTCWESMGLDPHDKIQWMGKAVSELLRKPSSKFLRMVKKARKNYALTESLSSLVGVQFRSFYDAGFTNSKFQGPFIEGVVENLGARSEIGPKSRIIYLTTDDPTITNAFKQKLCHLGRVITPPIGKTIHTAGDTNHIFHFINRVLRKVFRIEKPLDFWMLIPEPWRYRSEGRVLTEWYLLGECNVLFSTFTSFAVFGAARRGNQAELWKFDLTRLVFSVLSNEDYLF